MGAPVLNALPLASSLKLTEILSAKEDKGIFLSEGSCQTVVSFALAPESLTCGQISALSG